MSLFKRRHLLKLIYTAFYLFISIPVLAQSDPSGEKRVTGTYAITNATVFTSPGNTLKKATIIVKDGLIEEVGRNVQVPITAQKLNGDSLFIYAGFIDAAGNPGVKLPTTPERPKDFNPSNPPNDIVGITPYIEVLDHFKAEKEEIDDWRKVGITLAHLIPQGTGMLPGKTALVIYGQKQSSNILSSAAGMAARFKTTRGMYPGTTLGIMAKWRELYRNAELSAQHQALFASQIGINRPEKDKVLESFFPVIENKLPVIFEVSDELEIRRALRLQSELGFDLMLTGVREGANLIPDLKDAAVKVVLSLKLPEEAASEKEFENPSDETVQRLDRVKEAYKNSLELASHFEREGIDFAFSTLSTKSADLKKTLLLMIENGLSEEAALAALTINAAKILGIDKIAGSIEKGKLANLVITTDSLFKKESKIKYVFADGYLFDYETTGKPKDKKNEEDEAVGSWDYVTEIPEGKSSGEMSLKKESGILKGKITFDDPEGTGKKTTEMKKIERSGNTLKFDFDVDVKGMHISVTVSGKISGPDFVGTLSIPDFGSFPFSASKTPDSYHQTNIQ